MDPHTCPLKPEWLDYFRTGLNAFAQGGLLVWPGHAILQIDRQHTCMKVVAHAEGWSESDRYILTERCLRKLGWKLVVSLLPKERLELLVQQQLQGNLLLSFKGITVFLENRP